jgi:outer membrane protein assembly factor BamA
VAGGSVGATPSAATEQVGDAGESNGDTSPADRDRPDRGADRRKLRAGWSIAPFPVIFSTPETGFGGGVGAMLTHRSKDAPEEARPQSISFIAAYTQKSQTIVYLAPELYFDRETWQLRLILSYRDFPMSFFGVGNSTPREDEEEYTIEQAAIQPWLLRAVHSCLDLGITCNWQKASLYNVTPGGQLDRGAVTGYEGGTLSGLGPAASWDTRDHLFCPTRGSWVQLYLRFYRVWLGSDYELESWTLDLRRYFPMAEAHVLALQLLCTSNEGRVPFYELAQLGDELRGIYAERYVDRSMLMAQAEYRFPIWGRCSGAVFGGAGDVSAGLAQFRAADLKYAGGAGLRFALNPDEGINLRVDVGFGDEETQIYFQLLEAF